MNPIVMDLEASGLDNESYPIEVGFALENGDVHSWLIKREPGWTHWNPESAKIHNITRDQLTNEGLYAPDVAKLLNSHLSGKTVYTDAKDHDEFWVNVLFETVGIEREFKVESIQSLFINQLQSPLFYKTRNELYKKTVRHRAGNDAVVIQEAFIVSAIDTKRYLNNIS